MSATIVILLDGNKAKTNEGVGSSSSEIIVSLTPCSPAKKFPPELEAKIMAMKNSDGTPAWEILPPLNSSYPYCIKTTQNCLLLEAIDRMREANISVAQIR